MKKIIFIVTFIQTYILAVKIIHGSIVPWMCIIISNTILIWIYLVYKGIERREKQRTLEMERVWNEDNKT